MRTNEFLLLFFSFLLHELFSCSYEQIFFPFRLSAFCLIIAIVHVSLCFFLFSEQFNGMPSKITHCDVNNMHEIHGWIFFFFFFFFNALFSTILSHLKLLIIIFHLNVNFISHAPQTLTLELFLLFRNGTKMWFQWFGQPKGVFKI